MTIAPLYDESELLAKTASGDQFAFRILYEKYSKKIYTLSVRLLHSEILAEEVRQEVFLKLWMLGTELTTIDNVEAYLRTLTRNRCLNVLRRIVLENKSDRELSKNYVDAHNETEESILLNDTRNLLNAAIDLLPEQQRQVYLLRQSEGLKYEEIAIRLNISINTVKTHMKRALASLRIHVSTNTDVAVILIILKLL
jgi:RNA polymerase sigma-70 factor (ECF subfamily)